jgi:hypothetical protein
MVPSPEFGISGSFEVSLRPKEFSLLFFSRLTAAAQKRMSAIPRSAPDAAICIVLFIPDY